MGSARLQGKKMALEQGQQKPSPSQGLGNSIGKGTPGGMGRMIARKREQQAREQAFAATLRAAERASQEKTASLADAARGGASTSTNGYGSSTYTEGSPGQGDNQSQGDVDLSTSDTTLRRRGSYRRDSGISI